MNKDHLKIHKEVSFNSGTRTDYLINTYYDYALTFYFKTRQEAKKWIQSRKYMDKILHGGM